MILGTMGRVRPAPARRRRSAPCGRRRRRAEEVSLKAPNVGHGTRARCERHATMLLIVATALAGCSSMQDTAAIKGPIAQPVWKVGNEWAYPIRNPVGNRDLCLAPGS